MGGRTAIVTGSLTGIGLASARVLASAGHKVAVCGRRGQDPELVKAARAELGAQAVIGMADVADQASVDEFVSRVRAELGPPVILVNAAGIYRESFLDDGPNDAGFDQIEINLSGVFRTICATYLDMVAQGWGRIANIASTAGSKGAAGYAGYCASKAGVIGLSKSVAGEGAPHGIPCISISPTWVETPMMDNATIRIGKANQMTPQQAKEQLSASNPQGRLVQPSEIAALVGVFCSDASPALTNTDIQVNAGADW